MHCSQSLNSSFTLSIREPFDQVQHEEVAERSPHQNVWITFEIKCYRFPFDQVQHEEVAEKIQHQTIWTQILYKLKKMGRIIE